MSETRKITSIESQVKRQDRYSVFLDGEFAFGIAKDVLLESGIAKNDLLSQEQVDEILKLEERKQAKEKAIRLLAVRARSTKEIASRLQLAKFPQPTITWVIEELTRLRLLDDAEFAAQYARSRISIRPVGEYMLRQELKQKGVGEQDIENAVSAVYQGSSESQLARDLAVKRKRSCGSIDELKAKKRVSDFLLRRGFKWDLVGEIMENWEEL